MCAFVCIPGVGGIVALVVLDRHFVFEIEFIFQLLHIDCNFFSALFYRNHDIGLFTVVVA